MTWILFVFALSASDTAQAWDAANQAYRDGRYVEAVEGYEAMLANGVHNGKLHFNLGNAYFKSGSLGKAVLHFYRAERFLPGDMDIRQNLRLAAETRKDPIIEGEHEGVEQQLQSWMWRLPYGMVFWGAALFLVVAGLAGMGKIIGFWHGKSAGYALVCAGLLGILLTGLAFWQYQALTQRDDAVVISQSVDVLSGPSERESITFTIHEGIRVRILDRTDGWYRIRLANGFNGWLRRGAVEII